MQIDSYTCVAPVPQMRIRQAMLANNRDPLPPRTSNLHVAVQRIKTQLAKMCSMEIKVTMVWCICKCRNGWIFENTQPTVSDRKDTFDKELIVNS